MEKVIIEKDAVRKCVILEKEGEYVFRSGYGEFHEDVANNFREKEPELEDWRIRGGGRVRWSDLGIRVYGYSVDYGKMDKDSILNSYPLENIK